MIFVAGAGNCEAAICGGGHILWQAQCTVLEVGLPASLLEEISYEMLVLETLTCDSWDAKRFLRKSLTTRHFWRHEGDFSSSAPRASHKSDNSLLYSPTRVSYKSVPQESHKSVPRGCSIRVSNKSGPQECPTRESHKSVRQECLTRVSNKGVPQESPTRVAHKSVRQKWPTRVPHKSVPQGCSIRVSSKSKSALQGRPTRVSNTRVSHQGVRQECPTKVSHSQE